MTSDNASRDSDEEQPKKDGFDFSSFLKHVAEIDTPIGKLYLFPLRDSDLRAFNALSASDSVERTRGFLVSGQSSHVDGDDRLCQQQK